MHQHLSLESSLTTRLKVKARFVISELEMLGGGGWGDCSAISNPFTREQAGNEMLGGRKRTAAVDASSRPPEPSQIGLNLSGWIHGSGLVIGLGKMMWRVRIHNFWVKLSWPGNSVCHVST
ncbi:unnamed protein product [Linum trigynum]|uniref:Uncharacterized protein n=1 Tax=Linum trigynum TaxID=586398 RepID=A0AAV2DG13_9ROSI